MISINHALDLMLFTVIIRRERLKNIFFQLSFVYSSWNLFNLSKKWMFVFTAKIFVFVVSQEITHYVHGFEKHLNKFINNSSQSIIYLF